MGFETDQMKLDYACGPTIPTCRENPAPRESGICDLWIMSTQAWVVFVELARSE